MGSRWTASWCSVPPGWSTNVRCALGRDLLCHAREAAARGWQAQHHIRAPPPPLPADDHHIAELSVLETLQFAHACLTNQQQVDAGVTELERKLAAIEASTVREQNTLVQMEEGRAGATRSGPAGAGRAAPREKEASPGPEPQTLTANGASAAGDTPFARQPLPIGGAPDVGTETDEEFMDAASRRASSAASLASAYTDAREVLGEGTLASPGGVPVPSEGEPGAPSPAELAADAYKRAALMKHSSTYHLAAPKPLDANFMLQIL